MAYDTLSEYPPLESRLRDFATRHMLRACGLAGIVKPGGLVIVPRGEAVIEAGDRVVFFALEGCVQQLEADFLRPGTIR